MMRRALFISSAESGPELVAGASDCERIFKVLSNPEYGGHDPELSLPPLISCSSPGTYLDAINKFVRRSADATQRIVYFTGHGAMKGPRYGFQFGADRDFLPFSAITDTIGGAGIARTIFILDTCHSGGAELSGVKSSLHQEELVSGACILSSSRDIQFSHEEPELGSVFTHFLCECIETGFGGQRTPNGVITAENAIQYVKQRLDTAPTRAKGLQSPLLTVRQADGAMWIARNRSGSTKTPNVESTASADLPKEVWRQPCEGASFDDLDAELVASFVLAKGHTGSNYEVDLGLVFSTTDRRPTRASVLSFGRWPHRFNPNARSVFTSGDKAAATFAREDVEGPLIQQLRTLHTLVLKNISKRSRFDASGQRVDEYEIPTQVVREVISNAIAHRDFAFGRVSVHITDACVEITNPGAFPAGIDWSEFFARPGKSRGPNPWIAEPLQALGGGEGVGRGFSVLSEYQRTNGADAIAFSEEQGFVVCRLTRRGFAVDTALEASLASIVNRQARRHSAARTLSGVHERDASFVPPTLQDEDGNRIAYGELGPMLLQAGNRILLEGPAGGGKSYIMNMLSLDIADSQGWLSESTTRDASASRVVPLIIELRRLNDGTPLDQEIAAMLGVDRDRLGDLLPRTVVFMDGLDEMLPRYQRQLVTQLEALVEQNPELTLIVSSRPGGPLRADHGYTVLRTMPFSFQQAQQLLERHFSPEIARQTGQLLETSSGDSYRSPLLVSILAMTVGQYGPRVPNDPALLMEAIVRTLIERHDAGKGFHRDFELTLNDMTRVARAVSLRFLVMDTTRVGAVEFRDLIKMSLGQLDIQAGDSSRISRDLIDTSLFIYDGPEHVVPLHRSLLEHLAVQGAADFDFDPESAVRILRDLIERSQTPDLAIRVMEAIVKSTDQADRLRDELNRVWVAETPEAAVTLVEALGRHSRALLRREKPRRKLLDNE